MDEGQGSGSARYAASIAILVVTLALLGCGTLTLLPRPYSDTASTQLRSLKDLAAAYVRVQAGRDPRLAARGAGLRHHDRECAGALLSRRDGAVRRDSRAFDRLDQPLQDCIEARDRCTALVFKPGDRQHGGGMLASFGLGSANAASRDAVVTLLVQDGRVAYKTISGVPHTMLVRHEPAMAALTRPPHDGDPGFGPHGLLISLPSCRRPDRPCSRPAACRMRPRRGDEGAAAFGVDERIGPGTGRELRRLFLHPEELAMRARGTRRIRGRPASQRISRNPRPGSDSAGRRSAGTRQHRQAAQEERVLRPAVHRSPAASRSCSPWYARR